MRVLQRTPLRVFALVASSGFLAGIFVPVAVAGGSAYLPWLSSAGDGPTRLAASSNVMFSSCSPIGAL